MNQGFALFPEQASTISWRVISGRIARRAPSGRSNFERPFPSVFVNGGMNAGQPLAAHVSGLQGKS